MSADQGMKGRLSTGATCLGVSLSFPHAGAAEFLGRLGFDSIVVNAEHGSLNDDLVESIAIACELVGVASILRMGGDPELLERYVNLGITGVQLPRAQSVDHVRQVIDAVKFTPSGRRSIGNSRATRFGLWPTGYGELMAHCNRQTLITVQIEDEVGIEALPEIAALAEVDAILVGEMDLSNELGFPGQLDAPVVRAASDRIIAIARSAGKPVGVAANTASQAAQAKARGASYLLTSVSRCLAEGCSSLLTAKEDR